MAPTIDLAPFEGASLGVARKHALIMLSGNQCTVTDLDSATGTWLNGKPLIPFERYPLRNMDELRLGQFRILVHLRAARSPRHDARASAKILLQSLREGPLTPEWLASSLAPYLQAVAELQRIRDEILGREPLEVEVEMISHNNPVSVRLKGASAALDILQSVILSQEAQEHSASRGSQTQAVGRQLPDGPAPPDIEGAVEADQLPGPGTWLVWGRRDNRDRPQALQELEIRLAGRIVSHVAPGLAENLRIPFVVRLLPILDTLIQSDIRLIADREDEEV